MLRRLREERGIAPEDFGDRVGLDWRILAGMERGEYEVYLENIERIARALDMQPSELVRLAERSLETKEPGGIWSWDGRPPAHLP